MPKKKVNSPVNKINYERNLSTKLLLRRLSDSLIPIMSAMFGATLNLVTRLVHCKNCV